MTAEEIIATIAEYSLVVRCIPKEVRETSSMYYVMSQTPNFGNDDEIVESMIPSKVRPEKFEEYIERHNLRSAAPGRYRIDEEKKEIYSRYVRKYKYPEHGGWWLCQQKTNTGSNMQWSYKNDNLAPTLEESIQMCVNKIKEAKEKAKTTGYKSLGKAIDVLNKLRDE